MPKREFPRNVATVRASAMMAGDAPAPAGLSPDPGDD